MQTSSLRRQVKNMVNQYSEAEIKVREATSNDPWGPPSSLMSEIADLTFNVVAFTEVMGMIWKRLNDSGKNWRHVYKALTLLDYLIKTGSERVAQQCRENVYTIQTLRDFQFTDRDGRDQGVNVREKAKQLVALMRDEERLKQERTLALKTKERMAGAAAGSGMGSSSLPPPYPGRRTSQPSMTALYGDDFSRSRESHSSFNSTSSSPRRAASDMEQARPQTSGEEELQLQLALAMSREESEKPASPPPVALDTDEERQLQIALSLSKEEHQQEQRSRQGDESLLQKALEESKREAASGGIGSAMMDLVEVFAVPSEVPPTASANSWSLPGGNVRTPLHHPLPQAQAAAGAASDPWDSLVEARSTPAGIESPWMVPPTSGSPAPSWQRSRSPPDPWETPGVVDPFSIPDSLRTGSPTDGDLFDEAMDGGHFSLNSRGEGEGSPELFDLSRIGDSLGVPSPRTCRTPESFLGPTGASLVNLDSLIPANPPAKTKNPFLSGLSTPSPLNPFQSEQPRLTLNQMRPSSTSPVPPSGPPSLPYSASLPLPASHQPASLPSSLTQPTHGALDIPGLPQPLLPLSSISSLGEQHSQNPFL
ncbi:epsin-3-like isoform X2 [Oncorhynchus kisutch]|uniref:epsin-3-like isoform X2 n=1 Tax=Oncorhynchus kisutch TaxID=8019 RepID=UPI0012DE96BF|nr:epsin-3-like isoform X2 [Oncorhynchus kisutch]